MNILKYLYFIPIFFFIVSCGVITQRYTEATLTETQKTDLYRDYTYTDSLSVGNMAWRDFFTDEKLRILIERGLAQNYDFKNAVLRVEMAQNTLKQSRASFFPNLEFAPQIIHNKASQGASNFPANVNINLQTTSVSLGFTTNWEIDMWGKLSSAKRASQATLMQTIAAKKALQTVLISSIADTYYTLVALDKQLLITQETIQNRSKSVQALQALMESGSVTGADVVQAKANLYAAQVNVPELRQTIHQIENALCVLIAQPLQTIDRNAFDGETLNNELKIGVPVQLLSMRPDVQVAELNLRQAFELTNVAKASLYPTLRLSAGSAGISALTTRNLFDASNVFLNLTAGITQPIFQRRLLKTNYQNAIISQQQAINTFQQTLLTAGQEVTDALYAHQIAIEKQTARSQQIEALQTAVDFRMQLLTYSSFTNYTDVLSSEQLLLSAQLASVNDQLQEHRAIISLYRALGGGSQE